MSSSPACSMHIGSHCHPSPSLALLHHAFASCPNSCFFPNSRGPRLRTIPFRISVQRSFWRAHYWLSFWHTWDCVTAFRRERSYETEQRTLLMEKQELEDLEGVGFLLNSPMICGTRVAKILIHVDRGLEETDLRRGWRGMISTTFLVRLGLRVTREIESSA